MRRTHWMVGIAGAAVVLSTTAMAGGSVAAADRTDRTKVPQDRSALGNGLSRLVDKPTPRPRTASGGLELQDSELTIRDAKGRVLIDLTPREGVNRAAFQRRAEALGLVVDATDPSYGTLEGYAPVDAITDLAGMAGTGTIVKALRPYTNAGSVQSQGVEFQRVDKVQDRGIDGSGVTIGALSDSFDTATTDVFGNPLAIHAADDVASGDLPGPGNPRNSQPVVVLQDAGGGYDEGRAMLQIAHDVAPASKLCFATAYGGQLNFADNIRSLADKAGACGADVVVDDITYFDEPMFSDGVISDAIDDVAAQGVSYFSSAGNQGQQNAWQSPVRLLPAGQGLAGTNLDFTYVDPALYDGGLQDADPGPGSDVAQTIQLGSAGGYIDFQWDDPFDPNGPTLGASLFHATGELSAPDSAPEYTFTPTTGELGTQVLFNVDGVPSGSTDVILTVVKPDGTVLGPQDTGTSPEVLATTLDQAGDYTIIVTGYAGAEGPFTVDVFPIVEPSKVTTDFNLLFFSMSGSYLGAIADVNTLTGRPQEIVGLGGPAEYQMVISRSGTGSFGASELRIVNFDDVWFTEYHNPFAQAVFGHHNAAGGSSVAAYNTFRPYQPEYFTSPGGKIQVKFDSDGNRYPRTQIRQEPKFASTDGANTTFFVSDTIRDPDTDPNFFGTSAAAPHAASIAALVLQKKGGPGSVSPERMRALLQGSAFKHDLDPLSATGRAGGLTISAFGPQGAERSELAGDLDNPAFFRLTYQGRVPLRTITLYGETASPTAPGTRNPPRSDGMVFDTRAFDPNAASFQGVGFPFTVGGTSGGLRSSSVSATFDVPGGGTAVDGQYRHMTLRFANGMKRGQTLRFGVDRDLALTAYGDTSEGNGADELGGATFIPQNTVAARGLVFVARLANGQKLVGSMRNRIGSGWTPIDGYGVINAEKAVFQRHGHRHKR
jgi:Subtilase family